MAPNRMPDGRWQGRRAPPSATRAPGDPFSAAVDEVPLGDGFDEVARHACREFRANRTDRPGLSPGARFRTSVADCPKGRGSERGIAWRCGGSPAMRESGTLDADAATEREARVGRPTRTPGAETPTRADLAKPDRERPEKGPDEDRRR